jgi:methionyl-tRNA formyltransferase
MKVEDIKLKEDVKILFMGTPDFAVPVLEGLIENYRVRAVVTQPDKKVGREGILKAPPVKEVAEKNTILVLQPEKLKDAVDEIISLKPNLIITCAYGQLVPRELLVYPKYGCINVHASLLPKLRGGAPIHRAIINGNSKTGITIMHMNPYLDEGDIITQREVEILDTDTASSLHDKLSIVGRDLLLETLPSIIDGTAPRTPQKSEEATFAFNISQEDEKIDFNKTKYAVYNQVRGLNSWPGAYCLFQGKRMKVWSCIITDNFFPEKFNGTITNLYKEGIGVKVDNGEVILTEVQLEGKPKMKASDFLNGIQNKEELIGSIFE